MSNGEFYGIGSQSLSLKSSNPDIVSAWNSGGGAVASRGGSAALGTASDAAGMLRSLTPWGTAASLLLQGIGMFVQSKENERARQAEERRYQDELKFRDKTFAENLRQFDVTREDSRREASAGRELQYTSLRQAGQQADKSLGENKRQFNQSLQFQKSQAGRDWKWKHEERDWNRKTEVADRLYGMLDKNVQFKQMVMNNQRAAAETQRQPKSYLRMGA
jgi:hypothetical protein